MTQAYPLAWPAEEVMWGPTGRPVATLETGIWMKVWMEIEAA